MAFPDPINVPETWPIRSLSQSEFDAAVAGFYAYLESRQGYEVSWGAEAEALRADLVAANLPSLTGKAGKVLAVNDGEDGATFFEFPRTFRNKVINGDFRFWQRGTDFGITTADYAADRWECLPGGGQIDFRREEFDAGQADVPGDPQYFARWEQITGSTGSSSIRQKIEGVRTLANRTATVRFYIRSNTAAPTGLRVVLEQSFGTGGTPSADVVVDNNLLTGADAPTANWSEVKYTVSFPGVVGQTIGTNGDDHVTLRFTNVGTEQFDVDIANVSLVAGDATPEAEPPEALPYDIEKQRCFRYYMRGLALAGTGYANAGSQLSRCLMMLNFPVEMRAEPSVSYLVSNSDNVNVNPLSGVGIISNSSVTASPSSLASGSTYWRGTITLDAEL